MISTSVGLKALTMDIREEKIDDTNEYELCNDGKTCHIMTPDIKPFHSLFIFHHAQILGNA